MIQQDTMISTDIDKETYFKACEEYIKIIKNIKINKILSFFRC